MDKLSWLEQRRQNGNFRQLTPVKRLREGLLQVTGDNSGYGHCDFSSNDYLALSFHPDLIEASKKYAQSGTGAGAARLMSGDLTIYHELEEQVAQLKGQESALLFGSGYLANCGVIPALVGRQDVIFCDRLNHASIYDGCHLSRARLVRFHHNDLDHLESLLKTQRGMGDALIVVESVYSMDGDRCPLKELVVLKEKYNCQLMVDEAHATGLFGPNGGGVIEEEGIDPRLVDIAMGTFGKALGSYGAYIAASRNMVDFLINRARSFIYSTALPPSVIGASLAAIKIVQEQPELRQALFRKAQLFRSILEKGGLEGLGRTQILPILVGESSKALRLAQKLRRQRIFATAVRPPTVPEGTARLRFSITLHQSDDMLKETAKTLLADLQAG